VLDNKRNPFNNKRYPLINDCMIDTTNRDPRCHVCVNGVAEYLLRHDLELCQNCLYDRLTAIDSLFYVHVSLVACDAVEPSQGTQENG
jgi:hypothetical protein